MRYTTVLFDADGTLFDFVRCEREALVLACRKNGVNIDEGGIKLYSEINEAMWKALERGEIDKESLRVKRFEDFGKAYGFSCDFDRLSHEYTDFLAEQNFLIDGAEEMLASLYGKCRMYIITNGIEYVQKSRFAKSPINKYFEHLFISGEIGYEKPDVRFFDTVKREIPDFDAEKTLVVGDSLTSDMKGGINAGLDCCFYSPTGKKAPPEMNIKYTVAKLSDIKEIVYG